MTGPAWRTPRPHGVEVLLVDASGRVGLAAARSLGSRKIPFVALGHEPRGPVAASRYVRRYEEAPRPGGDLDVLAERVLEVAARYRVSLVVPLSDDSLLACDRVRDALPAGARIGGPPSAAVHNVLDKRRNLSLAESLGVPCPARFELTEAGQAREAVERVGLPLVLKHPGYPSGGGRAPVGFKWHVVRDERDLEARIERHVSADAPPIVQEHVSGPVHNLCCFAVRGEIVAAHQYRSLRRMEGASLLRELTDTSPELEELSRRLLRELRWEGAAQLAFVVRETDGSPRYMETNGRMWASLEGSVRAGWDFPYWTYRYFVHGQPPAAPSRAHGRRRMCWHAGDLQRLKRALDRADAPEIRGVGVGRALADVVSGYRPGIRSETFRLDDPRPALAEYAALVRRLAGSRP